MRVYVLPTAREVDTLYFVHSLGMSISTIRRRNGESMNVADQPSTVIRFPNRQQQQQKNHEQPSSP